MTVNIKSAEHEKKTAAKPSRRGKPLQFYTEDEQIDAIHEWAKQQPGRALTTSEAIRRLVDLGLGLSLPSGKGGKK